MEKSQFLQTHLILPDVPEEAVRSIGLEDKKLLSINHTLFNQDTHKECVREKPGVLVIHYYFNEKIEDINYTNSTSISDITEEDFNTILEQLKNHPLYDLIYSFTDKSLSL